MRQIGQFQVVLNNLQCDFLSSGSVPVVPVALLKKDTFNLDQFWFSELWPRLLNDEWVDQKTFGFGARYGNWIRAWLILPSKILSSGMQSEANYIRLEGPKDSSSSPRPSMRPGKCLLLDVVQIGQKTCFQFGETVLLVIQSSVAGNARAFQLRASQ